MKTQPYSEDKDMDSGNDMKYMKMAIEEAAKSKAEDNRAHPKVGVVIVSADGNVMATAHRGEIGFGEHGEYTALEKKLSTQTIAGATVYTTLEPCTSRNHPKVPCAVRLIERRVARVVIGMLDPNPNICGQGLWLLRESNVQTDLFPHALMSEVEEQNRDFIRSHRNPQRGGVLQKRDEVAEESREVSPVEKKEQIEESNTIGALYHTWEIAMVGKEFQKAQEIYSQLYPMFDDARKPWLEVMKLELQVLHANDEEAHRLLKEKVNDEREGGLAAFRLARLSEGTGDFTEACKYYRIALDRNDDENHRTSVVQAYADCLTHRDKAEEAQQLILKEYNNTATDNNKAALLVSLSNLTVFPSTQEDTRIKGALLLRAAQLTPTRKNLHFDAAMSLSDAGMNGLAASQYRAILRSEENNSSALNNLGVAYSRLGMQAEAIDSYRRSWAIGETLAAANLARKYVHAGFLDEAEKILNEARRSETVNDDVGTALVELGRARTTEAETWQKANRLAVQESEFLRQFVEAITRHLLVAEGFSGEWVTHTADPVLISDNTVTNLSIEWGETENKQRMTGWFIRAFGLISVDEWFVDPLRGYVYLSEQAEELRFMVYKNTQPIFFTWKKKK